MITSIFTTVYGTKMIHSNFARTEITLVRHSWLYMACICTSSLPWLHLMECSGDFD